jgi:hypothetical protein
MNQDYAQRRRVALAAAITVIAVPSLFLFNNDRAGRDGAVGGTVVGTVVGSVVGARSADDVSGTSRAAADSSASDVMGTTPVAYLDGESGENASDPATIAIPRPQVAIDGTASFRRDIPDVTTCQAFGVPFGSQITVTNLDNSRSVTCIASVGGAAPKDDVVLHPDAFVEIGDLTDAPIPVSITW